MTSNRPEYTAKEALRKLMEIIKSKDEILSELIQSVIDAGKDEVVSESQKGKKRPRIYRKAVSYSYEEALDAALNALQSLFVELPRYSDSLAGNLQRCKIEAPDRLKLGSDNKAIEVEQSSENISIAIALRPETKIDFAVESTQKIDPYPIQLIDEQQKNMDHLRSLTRF